MVGVPDAYRKSEKFVASFPFADIADGTGTVIYQGFVAEDSVAATFNLTSDRTLFSNKIESTMTSNVPRVFNLTPFNFPKTIKGQAILRFSIGGVTSTTTVVTKIQKVDLASAVTDIGTATALADISTENLVLVIDIPKTNFKKGENLRITLMVVDEAGITLGHDPANRAGAVITDPTATPTRLELHIPYKIVL